MLVNKNKRAFTLIELLAVIVILVFILAVGVPTMSNVIKDARKDAFASDVKLVIKSIERQISLDTDFDVFDLTIDNMKSLIDISPNNYDAIYVLDNRYREPIMTFNNSNFMQTMNKVEAPKLMSSNSESDLAFELEDGKVFVYIVGKNKWAGLIGQGTLNGVTVSEETIGCQEISDNRELYNKVVALDDGGYVVAGIVNLSSSYSDDAMISKHDENGAVVWTKKFAGSDDDIFYDIDKTTDGFIVVGSTFSDDGDITGELHGYQDALIIKYDLSGNIVWQKLFGGSDTDEYYGLSVVSDGYIAVGSSYSTDGDLTTINNSGSDGIIVKYDNDGNIVWKKTYGDANYQSFYEIINVADGYVIAGDTDTTGNGDALIVKYDLTGNLIWEKTTGGSDFEYFTNIDKTADGFIAIGSTYSDDGDINGLSKGNEDALLAKFDLSGNLIWVKTFGGIEDDYFTDIVALPDGYMAVGNSESHDADMATFTGGLAGVITKYDLNGNLLSLNFATDEYYSNLYGLVKDGNEYVAVGTYGDAVDAIINKYDADGDEIWSHSNAITLTICPDRSFCGLEIYEPYKSDYTTIEKDGTNYLIAGQYGGTSFIAKYGTNGKIIWSKPIPNSPHWDDNYASYLIHDIETTSNGYMAVGFDQDTNQAYLSKYDKNGNMLWKKLNDESAAYVVIKEFGTGYLAIVKDYMNDYIFLQKLDGNGNVIWTANDGSLSTNVITKDIEVLADGYLTIGGIYNAGACDAAATISKYNLQGDLIWTDEYCGSYENYFNGITVDDTGYIVAGSRNNTTTVLLKYAPNGDIIFSKTNTIDNTYDVEAVDGGYLLSGDALIKYDKDGDLSWQQFTEDNNPYLEAISIGNKYYAISGSKRNRSYYTIIDGAMHLTYFLRYGETNIYGVDGDLLSSNYYRENEFYLRCDLDGGGGGMPN